MNKFFAIDADNSITAYAAEVADSSALAGSAYFSSALTLERLAKEWPTSRLIEIWNSIPGQKPVKAFQSRATAIKRIWLAIQNLEPAAEVAPAPAKKERKAKAAAKKATRRATAPTEAKTPRDGSMQNQVLELMRRPGGASIEEIMKFAGWQRHTVRGFVAGACKVKLGLNVESFKVDGQRTYRIR